MLLSGTAKPLQSPTFVEVHFVANVNDKQYSTKAYISTIIFCYFCHVNFSSSLDHKTGLANPISTAINYSPL